MHSTGDASPGYPSYHFAHDRLPLGRVLTLFGSLLLKKLVFIVAATAFSIVFTLISWHLYEKQLSTSNRSLLIDRENPRKRQRRPEIAAACSQPPIASYE